MIVSPGSAGWLVVTQNDHAHFSYELMALWRAGGLPEHPRRDELLFAIREHDNGWRESDAAARLDPRRGAPHDFITLPADERIEIWRRGTRRYAEEHPYAALLITRHALSLHRDRSGDPAYFGLVAELEELAAELKEETAISDDELEADYRWLALGDLLSLVVCNRRRDPFERYGVSGVLENDDLLLAPFPLAGATRFAVPVRTLPRRAYGGDAEVMVELASNRWRELVVRVAPLG